MIRARFPRARFSGMHPGGKQQGEAQPYWHARQPSGETLWFRSAFDRAGTDVPVHNEQDPAQQNQDDNYDIQFS